MSKNFFKDGKWTDNPDAPKVRKCDCGNKYIKTRERQNKCLRCLSLVR